MLNNASFRSSGGQNLAKYFPLNPVFVLSCVNQMVAPVSYLTETSTVHYGFFYSLKVIKTTVTERLVVSQRTASSFEMVGLDGWIIVILPILQSCDMV